MKMRAGFVSNSSSASFIVMKKDLSEMEINILLNYNISEENIDGWTITEEVDRITGYTPMDNDALDEYLERAGFNFRKMEWHAE